MLKTWGKTSLNELVPFGKGGAFLPNSTSQLEIATSHRQDIRAGRWGIGECWVGCRGNMAEMRAAPQVWLLLHLGFQVLCCLMQLFRRWRLEFLLQMSNMFWSFTNYWS